MKTILDNLSALKTVATVLLAVSMCALVGCAAPEEEEEEQGETTSEARRRVDPRAEVINFARARNCDVQGNTEILLDCDDQAAGQVLQFARRKLGQKAGLCSHRNIQEICLRP